MDFYGNPLEFPSFHLDWNGSIVGLIRNFIGQPKELQS